MSRVETKEKKLPYVRKPIEFKQYPLRIKITRGCKNAKEIKSRINFMLMQSSENMSKANKESLREILELLNGNN